MNDRSHESRRARVGAGIALLDDTSSGAARRLPAREIRVPELYRRPMGDRELQGCLKARA